MAAPRAVPTSMAAATTAATVASGTPGWLGGATSPSRLRSALFACARPLGVASRRASILNAAGSA
eukprot:6244978-Prymnesium_polylepis.1